MSLVALGMGSVAAWLITRSITLPVARAIEAVRAVAGGDLSQRLHSVTRDELGQLLTTLDQMTQNLANMVIDVRNGASEINVAAAELPRAL